MKTLALSLLTFVALPLLAGDAPAVDPAADAKAKLEAAYLASAEVAKAIDTLVADNARLRADLLEAQQARAAAEAEREAAAQALAQLRTKIAALANEVP